MKVADVMSRAPRAVGVGEALDAAARVLWEQDCGFVPVTDGAGALVGVLTDRDLCMASYTQARPLAELPVQAAMARELATCRPGDDLDAAMETLREARVHRAPVVDDDGALVGVLSSCDLLQVSAARPDAAPPEQVLATLAAVKEPRSGARAFPPQQASKQPAARKAPKKKAPTKKAPLKKAAAKKTAAKKAAKKAPAKKAAPRKAAAKAAGGKGRARRAKA